MIENGGECYQVLVIYVIKFLSSVEGQEDGPIEGTDPRL